MNIIPNIVKIDTTHHLLKPIKRTRILLQTIIKNSYSKAGWILKEEELAFTEFTSNEVKYYLFRQRDSFFCPGSPILLHLLLGYWRFEACNHKGMHFKDPFTNIIQHR